MGHQVLVFAQELSSEHFGRTRYAPLCFVHFIICRHATALYSSTRRCVPRRRLISPPPRRLATR